MSRYNKIKNIILSGLLIEGTWEWAKKQLLNGKLVRRKGWPSYYYVDHYGKSRVFASSKLMNDWEIYGAK